MKTTFLIHTDLTITAVQGEVPAGSESFSTHKQLIALATAWPMERLVAIWNHLPAVTPVKRFKDRKTGVARIWTAIQNMVPAAAGEQATDAEPTHVEAVVAPSAPEPEEAAIPGIAPDQAAEPFEPQIPEPAPTPDAVPALTATHAAEAAPKKRKAMAIPAPTAE